MSSKSDEFLLVLIRNAVSNTDLSLREHTYGVEYHTDGPAKVIGLVVEDPCMLVLSRDAVHSMDKLVNLLPLLLAILLKQQSRP